jgi:hypothetical protein
MPHTFVIGDRVGVRYKSLNEWNEGHHLSGDILEIKGDQIKVDLPFASRDDGWYDANEAWMDSPKWMTSEEREDITRRLKIPWKDREPNEGNQLVADLLRTDEGRVLLAQIMVAPIRDAVKKSA